MPHYSKHKRQQLEKKLKLDQLQFQQQMKEYRMRQRQVLNQNHQAKIIQKLKSDKLRFNSLENPRIQQKTIYQQEIQQTEPHQEMAIQTDDLLPIHSQFQQVDQEQAQIEHNLQRLDVKALRIKALKGMDWLDQQQQLMQDDLKEMEQQEKIAQIRKEREIQKQKSIQQEKVYPSSSLSGRTELQRKVNSRFRWSTKDNMWGVPLRNSEIQSSSPARSRQVKPRQLISFRKPPRHIAFKHSRVKVSPGVDLRKLFKEDNYNIQLTE